MILLGKLGFDLTDKQLKRAGLDYWQFVSWEHIQKLKNFLKHLLLNIPFLSVHYHKPYTEINPKEGDYVFFGKETTGLPKKWMESFPERCFTVPMWETGVRSLNLGSSVAVVVFDGLRQLGKF
ncbi:MAG: putative tRNA (cytidine(34)-2'-O)-methyltransferase [Pseudomonadota bacterium]|nr:MAG: putative tRNA (cytidine(34)-2'-O)-methyltransferase [Pseudomonadota bacterium]